jgi:hypothetical protein
LSRPKALLKVAAGGPAALGRLAPSAIRIMGFSIRWCRPSQSLDFASSWP